MRDYVVLDIETTGISPDFAAITEIGAAKVIDGKVVDSFSELVNPMTHIPDNIVELTGINDEMVKDKRTIDEVIIDFIDFCEDYPILGHNVLFDFSFLKTNALRNGQSFEKCGLDTLVLARHFFESQSSYSLTNLLKQCGIQRESAHRGYDDAYATHELYQLIYDKHHTKDTAHNFVPKPFLWKPKKQSPITPKQKSFLTSLIRQHKVQVDYEVDSLTKSEASKKIDIILREYGRKL